MHLPTCIALEGVVSSHFDLGPVLHRVPLLALFLAAWSMLFAWVCLLRAGSMSHISRLTQHGFWAGSWLDTGGIHNFQNCSDAMLCTRLTRRGGQNRRNAAAAANRGMNSDVYSHVDTAWSNSFYDLWSCCGLHSLGFAPHYHCIPKPLKFRKQNSFPRERLPDSMAVKVGTRRQTQFLAFTEWIQSHEGEGCACTTQRILTWDVVNMRVL